MTLLVHAGEDAPSRLLLHRVISLTRKTASGSQSIIKTSSVLTLLACLGFVNRSAWIERAIGNRSPSSGATGFPSSDLGGASLDGSCKWNEKGTGSSSCEFQQRLSTAQFEELSDFSA